MEGLSVRRRLRLRLDDLARSCSFPLDEIPLRLGRKPPKRKTENIRWQETNVGRLRAPEGALNAHEYDAASFIWRPTRIPEYWSANGGAQRPDETLSKLLLELEVRLAHLRVDTQRLLRMQTAIARLERAHLENEKRLREARSKAWRDPEAFRLLGISRRTPICSLITVTWTKPCQDGTQSGHQRQRSRNDLVDGVDVSGSQQFGACSSVTDCGQGVTDCGQGVGLQSPQIDGWPKEAKERGTPTAFKMMLPWCASEAEEAWARRDVEELVNGWRLWIDAYGYSSDEMMGPNLPVHVPMSHGGMRLWPRAAWEHEKMEWVPFPSSIPPENRRVLSCDPLRTALADGRTHLSRPDFERFKLSSSKRWVVSTTVGKSRRSRTDH